MNLTIVKSLGDKAAQGRACGNLGNTHYLLGNFETAIGFHKEVSYLSVCPSIIFMLIHFQNEQIYFELIIFL